jgi:hypothetical protein
MASCIPTKQEAEKLIGARKIISASVSWKSFMGSWRLEAKALEPESNAMLKLLGYIGKDNYSFTLLYVECPIRKYTKHDKHKFQGKVCRVPHKHTWDEINWDAEIYIPTDINPTDDINDQFLDFCRECNIELSSGYQRLVYELGR